MEKIFKLKLNTIRSDDEVFDATLVPFDGSNNIRYYFSDPELYSEVLLPSVLYFEASFDYLVLTDFPYTDSGVFLISKNVLNILDKFSEFKYDQISATMIDDTFLEDRFDKYGLNPRVPINEDYVGLRFPLRENYFDFDNSIYQTLRSNPKAPTRIQKLVLKEPESKFPVMFRIREKSSLIFVSEGLKNELEENNIKGCLFEEIEITQYK